LQQVLGMTPEIYKRVAPRLTIYAVGAGILFGAPERVYSIRAAAEGPNGATSVRQAVVQLRGGDPQILVWRQGAGIDSPTRLERNAGP
jgi:hypothetical protein